MAWQHQNAPTTTAEDPASPPPTFIPDSERPQQTVSVVSTLPLCNSPTASYKYRLQTLFALAWYRMNNFVYPLSYLWLCVHFDYFRRVARKFIGEDTIDF